MTIEDQIDHDVNLLLQLSPGELNELLDAAVEVDSEHTLTAREVIAKCMVEISRHPLATRECRARALRTAKLCIGEPSMLDIQEWTSEDEQKSTS
jgi:hypothetical protein